ncbi:hypothetical protein NDU88_004997 [Pleurodeles waltl]|uniref:Reverse transcriptase domain-containing protein n=1 Tax=Pleurodeles waltl TaxID=8319 RepID=A0AAV7RJT6_PLEWA|nr:hypothetical protein NDU88_004997 [Pleurodeles waltl]
MGMEGVLADIRKSLAALAPTAQPGASPTPPPGLDAPASSGPPPVHVPEHQVQEQNPTRTLQWWPKKIEKERALGRLAGPFKRPPLAGFVCSPLGVVPKKEPGQFRLIHNLSAPRGSSVNDAIDPQLYSVRYASVDNAIDKERALGRGALLAKNDIESAFRLLPVHPADYHLLGFQFRGEYF